MKENSPPLIDVESESHKDMICITMQIEWVMSKSLFMAVDEACLH